MAIFRRQNWPLLLFALAFRNRMLHCLVNVRNNSGNTASTSCERVGEHWSSNFRV